jgi:hypothetical protein
LPQFNKKLVDYPVLSLVRGKLGSFKGALAATVKKESSNRNHWRYSRKTKSLLAAAIIVIMVISIFEFLPREKENPINQTEPQSTEVPSISPDATTQESNPPSSTPDTISQIASAISGVANDIITSLSTPKSPGTFESAQTMDSSVWRQVAANAWRYFSPGVGVDSKTGLPFSGGEGAPYFTDWDLGVYIQAVIDANDTGLIDNSGSWGSSARLEKVMSFLEQRELNSTTSYPFWFYQAADGKDYHKNSDKANSPVDTVDTGRLFVALNNLRTFNSSLAPRINAFVRGPGNRSDYAALVPDIISDSFNSKSIYAYYISRGFTSFWPKTLNGVPSRILSNIFSASKVTTNGVSLPMAEISCDPLLCSVFETKNNTRLMTLTREVYLAHEAYYNATGTFRAFSEGSAPQGNWAYEWVVLPNGRTWAVLYGDGPDLNIPPVIYTKTSISFLAIYNTSFAKNMTVNLERNLPDPSDGYCEGVDEAGTQDVHFNVHTNGLIIGAAKYAMQSAASPLPTGNEPDSSPTP